MLVRISDSETVLVETDADSEYDRLGRLATRFEPNCLELAGESFRCVAGEPDGAFRPRATAKAGDVGHIIVSITKPDGEQLSDTIELERFCRHSNRRRRRRRVTCRRWISWH